MRLPPASTPQRRLPPTAPLAPRKATTPHKRRHAPRPAAADASTPRPRVPRAPQPGSQRARAVLAAADAAAGDENATPSRQFLLQRPGGARVALNFSNKNSQNNQSGQNNQNSQNSQNRQAGASNNVCPNFQIFRPIEKANSSNIHVHDLDAMQTCGPGQSAGGLAVGVEDAPPARPILRPRAVRRCLDPETRAQARDDADDLGLYAFNV